MRRRAAAGCGQRGRRESARCLAGRPPIAASRRDRGESLRAPARPSRMAARSRGPPRPTDRRRQRALEIGHGAQALRAARRASRRASTKIVDLIEPRIDRRGIGQRIGEALGQDAAPAAVTVMSIADEQAAALLARKRAGEFEIGARRRIDQHGRVRLFAPRRAQKRHAPDLGQHDIVEEAAEAAISARVKAAEAVERRDREMLLQPALAGKRCRSGWRAAASRRRRSCCEDLRAAPARRAAHRQRRFRSGSRRARSAARRSRAGRHHRELAGRNIGPGERQFAVALAPAPVPRDNCAGCDSRSESSVSVPGVTSRTTSRRTTDLAPRLLGFGRILHLLADGDPVAHGGSAAADSHRRHGPARRTSECPRPDACPRLVSAMPSAARGDLGIGEEHLVEIAHPVEQQAAGIGRLDLEILRHHRRRALGRPPRRRRRWPVSRSWRLSSRKTGKSPQPCA